MDNGVAVVAGVVGCVIGVYNNLLQPCTVDKRCARDLCHCGWNGDGGQLCAIVECVIVNLINSVIDTIMFDS